MKGLELSRQFYETWGRPMLMEQFSEYVPLLRPEWPGKVRTVSDMMMSSPGTMILRQAFAFGFRTGWSGSWNLRFPEHMESCRRNLWE